jgi:UDP-glucose 4-epimerase
MKVLVTGGAGFIGSNLIGYLVGEGHEVTVLDNLSSGYQRNLDALSGARFIHGDIRDEDSIERVTAGRDVVFHLAASVGNKRSIDNPISDAEINVIGTLRILEASRKAGVQKVVISSSAGIVWRVEDAAHSRGSSCRARLTLWREQTLCGKARISLHERWARTELAS